MSKAGEAKNRANRWAHLSGRINTAETPTARVQFASQLLAAVVVRYRAHRHPLVEALTRQLVEAAQSIEKEASNEASTIPPYAPGN